VACYLREGGVTAKPFVVALASMAAKGAVRIERGPGDYLISKLGGDAALEAEEQEVADNLFKCADSVLLNKLFPAFLNRAASRLGGSLEAAVEPELISRHFAWLVPGLTLSFWSLLAALYPDFDRIWNEPTGRLIFLPLAAEIVAVLAILKTLPAIIYKIRSRFVGQSAQPLFFTKSDLELVYLLLIVGACTGAIAFFTSWVFACQGAGFLVLNAVAALAFRAPTAKGYRALDQLADFGTFLAEVDADRVNRMSSPTGPSPSADKNWVWALALGIEHAWGEQFAAAVLNRIGTQAAIEEIDQAAPEEGKRSLEIMDLGLNK
jgi:hypothetical protein